MIAIQVLNKLLTSKNPSLIIKNSLDSTDFTGYEKEFNFIKSHYDKYGNIPDTATFLTIFPEFPLLDIQESDEFLVKSLLEQSKYEKACKVLNKCTKLMLEDSHEAVNYVLREFEILNRRTYSEGIDLISQADERLNLYENKSDNTTKSIIRTGLKELDGILYGLDCGEELLTIQGRTNQGKTWLLLKILVEAWKQGKRVGLYSGEMSAIKIGYRVDTLINHFSNTNLIHGLAETGYKEFINDLKTKDNPFIVVTRKELGGRATVQKLRNVVEIHNLDILGIDQYSLMDDSRGRRGDEQKDTLSHIAEDLFQLSIDYSIPVVGLAQTKRLGNVTNDSTPQLEDIGYSDAIAQNSSKVLSMRQTAAGLKITVLKNREGSVGANLLYYWDIDRGDFKYIPSHDDANVNKEKEIQALKESFNDEADVF